MTRSAQVPAVRLPQAATSAVDAFEQNLARERVLSPKTVRNYVHAVTSLLEFLVVEFRWTGLYQSIESRMLRSRVVEMQRTVGRRTVHLHASAWRSFFRFLQRRGEVNADPTVLLVLPKTGRALPRFLTERQMESLLRAPATLLRQELSKPAEAVRDQAMLELLYGAGLRVSELTNLTWGQVDRKERIARVLGKGSKTRVCPFSEACGRCLESLAERQPAREVDPVLRSRHGLPVSDRWVQRRLKTLLLAAGLPSDLTPHKLRHSFATHLTSHGADLRLVQELLGHAKLTSTEVYTHTGLAGLRKTHRQAHPRG